MSTPGHEAHKPQLVDICDQLLVFVVRRDGEPGLYLDKSVTAGQAGRLLEMMAEAVRTDPRFSGDAGG